MTKDLTGFPADYSQNGLDSVFFDTNWTEPVRMKRHLSFLRAITRTRTARGPCVEIVGLVAFCFCVRGSAGRLSNCHTQDAACWENQGKDQKTLIGFALQSQRGIRNPIMPCRNFSCPVSFFFIDAVSSFGGPVSSPPCLLIILPPLPTVLVKLIIIIIAIIITIIIITIIIKVTTATAICNNSNKSLYSLQTYELLWVTYRTHR